MAAAACGLTISVCARALWVVRHSVPVACLSLPCVFGSEMRACYGLTQFLASLFLLCAVPVTTGSFWMIATSDELLAIHLGLVDL